MRGDMPIRNISFYSNASVYYHSLGETLSDEVSLFVWAGHY